MPNILRDAGISYGSCSSCTHTVDITHVNYPLHKHNGAESACKLCRQLEELGFLFFLPGHCITTALPGEVCDLDSFAVDCGATSFSAVACRCYDSTEINSNTTSCDGVLCYGRERGRSMSPSSSLGTHTSSNKGYQKLGGIPPNF